MIMIKFLQTLAAEIDKAEDRKLKHIDLRHSRIPEAGKKVIGGNDNDKADNVTEILHHSN